MSANVVFSVSVRLVEEPAPEDDNNSPNVEAAPGAFRVISVARANILYDPSHLVLQQLDYLSYIDTYHGRIKAFHVKDAEFRPSGRQGVYGGFQAWKDRAGRFRSLGDGQVDFTQVFSRLTAGGYKSWAVIEWECVYKDSVQGATEGAPFVEKHLIEVPTRAFDDFAGGASDTATYRRILGLG